MDEKRESRTSCPPVLVPIVFAAVISERCRRYLSNISAAPQPPTCYSGDRKSREILDRIIETDGQRAREFASPLVLCCVTVAAAGRDAHSREMI